MPLQAQHLQQQGYHRLLIEEILHLQGQGGLNAPHPIVYIVLLAYTQGILQHLALYRAAGIYLLLHAGIHLLPETGNRTHTGRMNLAQTLQNLGGPQVYSQRTAGSYAQI